MRDPFHDQSTLVLPVREVLAEGAVLMRGFALPHAKEVMAALEIVTRQAPFRHMITLGGFTMSVAMTNCGSAGWVTDRTGYRYDPIDPETGEKWPTLPSSFLELAGKAAHEAGYPDFVPDATPDIDLASVPSDTKAAVGYQELYALWKADQEAFNQGPHVSDAEYLIWMARVRMHLTPEEKALFDEASKDNSIDEFRAEKSVALVKILWDRHGYHVAKLTAHRV